MKICAILVIYNKRLSDSASFRSAVSQPDVQLLVVDNSTDESFRNQEEARQAGAWFLSMKGNKGLAKAYNAAFERFKPVKSDWLILLDDDTEIPDSYWQQLRVQKPDTILLPIVVAAEGKMISPAEMKHDFPHPVSSPDQIKNITGINSGMAIPKIIADTYRYDERYFLDYVDHQFLKDMKRKGYPVRILQEKLIQSFSADSTSLKASLNRLKIQRSDFLVYYEKEPWKAWFLMTKRKLRLAIQYRNAGIFFHE